MNSISLSFQGMDEYKMIRNVLKDFLDNHLEQQQAFLINVAMNEVINNCFIHGKSNLINVHIVSDEKKIVIRIEDNGPHFFNGNDYMKRIRDSNIDLFTEDIYREGQRGLLIIEEVCDDVIYNPERNEVILIKEK